MSHCPRFALSHSCWSTMAAMAAFSSRTEEVAVGVGEAPVEGSSISNLAFVVPPTVVKDRDAEDPASLACWRSSSSAASIFGAQNLNLKMAGKQS